jgi:hypothetical protein
VEHGISEADVPCRIAVSLADIQAAAAVASLSGSEGEVGKCLGAQGAVGVIGAAWWGGGGRGGSPWRGWRWGASRGGASRPLTHRATLVGTGVGSIGRTRHKT